MTVKSLSLAILATAMLGLGSQDGFQRERGPEGGAAKDALEGKAPAELVGEWFNTDGKKLDWNALKGKVVVLDFWAHW